MANIIEKQLQFFEQHCEGMVGVYAKHLPSNAVVAHNQNHPFFMASTFKLPLAITLLRQIEQGKKQLTDKVQLQDSDQRHGAYIISRFANHMSGVELSLQNLLEFTISYSDNAATDILFREVGGTDVVQATIKELNLSEIDITRTALQNILDLYGINKKPEEVRDEQHLQILADAVPVAERQIARAKFTNNKVTDTTTPIAMARLLEGLFKAEYTSEKHRDLLLSFMYNCKTFKNRLPGLLPEGTPVARKTGTINHYASDVGIITLPHEQGHVVIAVYIQNAKPTSEELGRTIAEISRTIYDYFLLLL